MKTKRLSIRISETEQLMLRERAKRTGVSLTTFVIEICRKGLIIERCPLSAEEKIYYQTLSKHAQMWQSAANLFHNGENREFKSLLQEMADIMKADRKKLIDR